MAEGHEEAEEADHEVLRILIVALLGLILGTFVRFTETQLLPIVRDVSRCASLALPPYSLSVFIAGAITSAIRDALSSSLSHTMPEEPTEHVDNAQVRDNKPCSYTPAVLRATSALSEADGLLMRWPGFGQTPRRARS
jgi:hypothetical protein